MKDFDEDLNVFEMSEGGVVYVRRQSTREAVRAFRGFMCCLRPQAEYQGGGPGVQRLYVRTAAGESVTISL